MTKYKNHIEIPLFYLQTKIFVAIMYAKSRGVVMKRLFYGALYIIPLLGVIVLYTNKVRTDQQMKPALQEQRLIKELFNALEAEDAQRVHYLLQNGAPVDGYYNGVTPLIYVARLNKFAPVAWVLLQAGANVDAQDEYGKTALMWVVDNASKENIELARLLLDYGADICKKDADGRSVWDRVQERQMWDRQKGHGIRELIMSRAHSCLRK